MKKILILAIIVFMIGTVSFADSFVLDGFRFPVPDGTEHSLSIEEGVALHSFFNKSGDRTIYFTAFSINLDYPLDSIVERKTFYSSMLNSDTMSSISHETITINSEMAWLWSSTSNSFIADFNYPACGILYIHDSKCLALIYSNTEQDIDDLHDFMLSVADNITYVDHSLPANDSGDNYPFSIISLIDFLKKYDIYIIAGALIFGFLILVARNDIKMRQKAAAYAQNYKTVYEKTSNIHADQRQTDALKQQEALKKPIAPPKVQKGFCLTYFYPDVSFIVPSELRNNAERVIPHKPITLTVGEDGQEIFLSCDRWRIGRMYDNKLRQMVHDYNRDEDHTVLAVSCYWTNTPVFSLAFYMSIDLLAKQWQQDPDFKKCTLIGNTSAELQDAIDLFEVGYPVDIDMDFDKDKYAAVADALTIGYLPASLTPYIEEHGVLKARIMDISVKESGKKAVIIMMIPDKSC